MKTKLTRCDAAFYRDGMERFWVGFRGPAKIIKDGKRVSVADRLQFLLLGNLMGPPLVEDYEIVGGGDSDAEKRGPGRPPNKG